MESIATFIYPQVTWRGGKKKLWNPIHRKPLKNRPEERVRLRIIEFLLRSGWSKHRISTEEAIGKSADKKIRTDIICYSRQFTPRLLIECKAEHIPLSPGTAEQIARYNRYVGSPYLLMSNGIADFWYAVHDGGVESLEKKPGLFDLDRKTSAGHFDDWRRRGFAGSEASPELRKWFSGLLPALWHVHPKPPSTIRFLTFNQELGDLDLNHYYVIQQLSGPRRLAISTLATASGGSRLVAILNEENQNRAVLEINLDLLFDGNAKNSTIYSEAGTSVLDATGMIPGPNKPERTFLTDGLHNIFLEYVG